MRDINRIDPLLAKLGEFWKQYPDMRFGQLIINLLDNLGMEPWYLEDDAWMAYLDLLEKRSTRIPKDNMGGIAVWFTLTEISTDRWNLYRL